MDKITPRNPAEAFGGKPGPGRPKGMPNKTTALLKDAILKAAEAAGNQVSEDGKGGMAAYLQAQAITQPAAFMGLLGKVLPMQHAGDPDNPITIRQIITGVPRAGDA